MSLIHGIIQPGGIRSRSIREFRNLPESGDPVNYEDRYEDCKQELAVTEKEKVIGAVRDKGYYESGREV